MNLSSEACVISHHIWGISPKTDFLAMVLDFPSKTLQMFCYQSDSADHWLILERNYLFTQVAVPGGTVNNTYPTPDLSQQGPYAVCAKRHDLNNVMSNVSWTKHSRHVSNDGFSCSVCHTAHGLGSLSAGVSGERLINFDVAVVGQNQASPISYNRGSNTCTLTCHSAVHNVNGTVAVNGSVLPQSMPVVRH